MATTRGGFPIPPPSAFASPSAKASRTPSTSLPSGSSRAMAREEHQPAEDDEPVVANTNGGNAGVTVAAPTTTRRDTRESAAKGEQSNGATGTSPQRPRCPSSAMETERDYEIGEFLLPELLPSDGGNNHEGGVTRRRRCCLLSRLCTRSLAAAPTTPCVAAWSVPLLAFATHALFYHGQTADMWRLQSAANVDCWYNATSLEAKGVYRLIGLGDPYDLSVTVNQTSTVQTFTYYTAIQELWDAAGMNVNVVLPRLASILLILFSGIWPHLKLLLLNVGWWLRPNSPRLFWWLSALGKWSLSDVLVVCVMLGVLHVDWELHPDVLLHGIIDQAPTLLGLLPGLYTNGQICTQLLGRPCDESRTLLSASLHPQDTSSGLHPPFMAEAVLGWDLKCSACLRFVESSLAHPATFQSTLKGVADGISTSGGGLVTLRVQGLPGIYSFCAAVVLSIALSCVVDLYALKAETASSAAAVASRSHLTPPPSRRGRQQSLEHPLLLEEEGEEDGVGGEGGAALAQDAATAPEVELGDNTREDQQSPSTEPFREFSRATSSLSSHSSQFESPAYSRPTGGSCQSFWHACGAALAVVTCAIVWKTIPAPSLLRQVTGVGPHWLQQLTGVQWDVTFSLKNLAQAVGEAGGMDVLLQATFAWFCLVGPAVRAALCVVALCWPVSASPRSTTSGRLYGLLLTAIEFVGAFCAVEVLAIAAYLVHLLIPSTTATIVDVPQCAQIAPTNSTSACFEVFLEPQEPFEWLFIGTLLLLLVSQVPAWLVRRKQPFQRQRR